jgi:hypothetical protein
MLLRYYVETEEYSTSALTVSQACTPNVLETPNGFECDAFFPPEMLKRRPRRANR